MTVGRWLRRLLGRESALFCDRCAHLTRRLRYDPSAKPCAELMSGSCMWKDEVGREWCTKCVWAMRAVFRLRHCMAVGEPLDPQTLECWQRLEREFPAWPLFRPERRSPEVGPKVRQLVDRSTRRACITLERMDRAYRRRQTENEGSA